MKHVNSSIKGQKVEMKIRYLCKPSALNIQPGNGLERGAAIKFALNELMKVNVSLQNIVYGDDVFVTILPFSQQDSFLMCPVNAQESVKKLVLEKGGFVSQKRSTEAVAEFLTDIYPNKYQSKHCLIHSIYFDMDGVLREEERLDQNLPFFSILTDYIKNCKGPYTASPPISIATGAYRKSLMSALDYIPLNKHTISARFHRNEPPLAWPPIIYEEGYLVFDPVNEITLDLTEEKYGLVSPVYRKLITLIMGLGKKINERVPEINKEIGAECKITPTERVGYNLDLPLEVRRGDLEDLRSAHAVIYNRIRDLFEKHLPHEIEIEFGGLFSQNELEQM